MSLLRALAALAEAQGSVPGMHVAAHICNSSFRGDWMPSDLCRPQALTLCTYIHAGKVLAQIREKAEAGVKRGCGDHGVLTLPNL